MTPNTQGNPRTVMLHGFTQNHRCLGPIADWLGETREVFTPDLPGHSAESSLAHLDCAACACHLAELCGYGDWIGYSLGGRIALHVALQYPNLVRSLVLIGATPGIEDDAARHDRRRVDNERADAVEHLGVEEFCRRWLAMPMFARLPERAKFLEERHSNTVEGLAGSLRNAGTGSMEPLWDRLVELEMPVLLLAGELDPAYVDIASRMAALVGANAELYTVTGAGHAAHLESPEITISVIEEFLVRVST